MASEEEQLFTPRTVQINLEETVEARARAIKPLVGINPGDTVSWNSSRIKVEFIGFEPAKGESTSPGPDINPFEEPPRLTNNRVKKDAPKGIYTYTVRVDDITLGGGTIRNPEPPDG